MKKSISYKVVWLLSNIAIGICVCCGAECARAPEMMRLMHVEEGAANNIITNWTFPATFTIADTVYFCVTNNGHYSVFAETNLVSAGRIYMGANEYHAIKGVFSMATLSNAPVEVLANIYAISNSLNNIRHLSMLHPDSPYCHSFSWRKNIWLHTTFASTNRLEISERILIGQ